MTQIELPFGFWYESPSPFTFFFWIVIWIWGLFHLPIQAYSDVKRFTFLYRLVNGMMIVGFVVFIYDTSWIICQGIKFGSLYPEDLNVLLIRLIQNVGLLWVCFFYIRHLFEKGILEFSSATYDLLIIQAVYFGIWFVLAPDPSWTDWTYAIRNLNYDQVLTSFIISHLFGKIIQGLIFISLFSKGFRTWRKPIEK